MAGAKSVPIGSAAELIDALASEQDITVAGRIVDVPPLTLRAGQRLRGIDQAMLVFVEDGLALTADNQVEDLTLVAPVHRRSVMLADHARQATSLTLLNLSCYGQIQLIFGDESDDVALRIERVVVTGADAGVQAQRPHANGVDVLQGALTVWNRSSRASVVRLDLRDVEIGAAEHPVVGTGLFVAGAGDGQGGRVICGALRVGQVHSDSGLPVGTTDTVAGGVFMLQDVEVDEIVGTGSVTTRGPNAVPIDNWGSIRLWRLNGDAVSHGPSAIGVINAGQLDRLEISGVVETFGDGARGCGIYGPTGTISAHAVRTHGSAAIGVQVIASLDCLQVRDGIVTHGSPGEGLVKGVMVETPAHAIHVEHGGTLGRYDGGPLTATGRAAEALRNDGRVV